MLKLEPTFLSYIPQRLPDSVGIVCFHKGDWRTGLSKAGVNTVYLLKTLASLSSCVDKVFLYVCESGMDFVSSLYDNVEVRKLSIPTEYANSKMVYPIGKYGLLDRVWVGRKFVFFTESDQIIYSKRLGDWAETLSDVQYLSPHRMERRYLTFNHDGQPLVRFDGKEYILYNNYENELIADGDFWRATTFKASYGAAWIARTSLLDDLDFRQYPEDALHAPCRVLFDSAQSLKTKNPFDFFVDHLSGFDNALVEAGHSIQQFPGRW